MIDLRIAGVIQVRMASQRCRNKNLRPFGDTNLTRLALGKFSESREVTSLYLAAYEQELVDCAKHFRNVKVIRRNKDSAYAEDFASVLNYVGEVEEDTIAFINTSAPFLQLSTFDKALAYFKEHAPRSMAPAFASYGWYFGADGSLLNKDSEAIKANSKLLKPIYKFCPAFIIANKERILREHTYWSLTPGDPHLYIIDEKEAIDIDTELDFKIAEALYIQQQNGNLDVNVQRK